MIATPIEQIEGMFLVEGLDHSKMAAEIREVLERYVPDPLRAFAREVAACRKDGEEWEMENDDAYDMLHSLISDARELVSGPTKEEDNG
jgi:hypothetical protein